MNLSRQQDLVDSRIFKTPITIIGAGAIGSFTTLALAKMGFEYLLVFDDDVIEEHNLPNQFYTTGSLGVEKVIALRDIVKDFTDVEIAVVPERWQPSMGFANSTISPAIVISAVDTMKVREEIYNTMNNSRNIFIDGRMGGHQLEVRSCVMSSIQDKKKYKKTLWKDSETSPLPCTQKAVMYNVLMIASLIANQCRLILEGKRYNREIIYDFETGIMLSTNECLEIK